MISMKGGILQIVKSHLLYIEKKICKFHFSVFYGSTDFKFYFIL